MNFSAWAIRKPIPSILLFILITVAGLVSFKMLSIQNFPDIDFPAVSVTATLPGATPTQMETEVTRKIEDSIASIGAIKHITSTINDGSSTTMVEFQLEKDVQEAVNDVRDAVSRIRAQLPSDVQEPVISRVTFASLPVLTYARMRRTWTRKTSPGSSTTRSTSACCRCMAWRRSRARAAWTAKCAYSSTPCACRP